MQGKITLSSADIASRIAFIREKQGVTLITLGEGKASTAQSWIGGKTPRRDKWGGIAGRLGVSEMLIFMGKPESPGDYAFLRKWRNEIADYEQLTGFHGSSLTHDVPEGVVMGREQLKGSAVEETPADVGSNAERLNRDIRAIFEGVLRIAGDDVSRLGWLVEEMRRLQRQLPEHWHVSTAEFERRLAEAVTALRANPKAGPDTKEHAG